MGLAGNGQQAHRLLDAPSQSLEAITLYKGAQGPPAIRQCGAWTSTCSDQVNPCQSLHIPIGRCPLFTPSSSVDSYICSRSRRIRSLP
jgi:hypothetical protein